VNVGGRFVREKYISYLSHRRTFSFLSSFFFLIVSHAFFAASFLLYFFDFGVETPLLFTLSSPVFKLHYFNFMFVFLRRDSRVLMCTNKF